MNSDKGTWFNLPKIFNESKNLWLKIKQKATIEDL